MTTLRSSVRVQAPAQRVWELVSDLPAMGALSPENTGGTWRGGATGPALGARFRGSNRNGVRRWSTSVRVVSCQPPEAFAFDVSFAGIPVARWAYDVHDEGGDTCTVTETWLDRRPGWFRGPAGITTGVRDREAHTQGNLERTLAALKRVAEG